MRIGLAIGVGFLVLLVPVRAGAVSLDAGGARLSLGGYLDLQYTYMDRMPMKMGATVVPMAVVSTLDQDHLNLIFKVERNRMLTVVNLQSRKAFTAQAQSDGSVDGHGRWEVLEAYGEYQFSDAYGVRGGQFLAPFGFYNHMQYAIALFAPVVLPTFYEPPANYAASGGLDHLVPDVANLMLNGVWDTGRMAAGYAVYLGSGHRTAAGTDANRTQNVGAKLELKADGQDAAVSVYRANEGDTFGDRLHAAAGVDLTAGPANLQGEWLRITTRNGAADVVSWYVRLTGHLGRTQPFVGYDYLKDAANLIYGGGMSRWSAGVSHDVSATIVLKAEVHRHRYDGAAIPASVRDVNMLRVAAIVVF